MKTKIVPFDLETAKKIQAGEIEGAIETRKGLPVRLLCTNVKGPQCVVTATLYKDGSEVVDLYGVLGNYNPSGAYSEHDIVLEVPETEPEFKVGDKVRVIPNDTHSSFVRQYDKCVGKVVGIDNECFLVLVTGAFQDQFKADELELVDEVENHEFKPFDKVLVRDDDSGEWCLALYAYYREATKLHRMVGGACWEQCIPYEGNEHLSGTTDKPKEE